MKKILTIAVLLLSFEMYANWLPYGPQGINALNICFNLDMNNHIGICHSTGIYLYDYQDDSWTNYELSLPILTAHFLDGYDILLIAGDGTDSDGIYSLNPDNGEFTVLENLEYPNFLYYDELTQMYYAGHHMGLLMSSDGINWNVVDLFTNMNIISMDSYQNHMVVSCLS